MLDIPYIGSTVFAKIVFFFLILNVGLARIWAHDTPASSTTFESSWDPTLKGKLNQTLHPSGPIMWVREVEDDNSLKRRF